MWGVVIKMNGNGKLKRGKYVVGNMILSVATENSLLKIGNRKWVIFGKRFYMEFCKGK